MKKLTLFFFRGVITILPLGLTVYLLYFILTSSETLVKSIIEPFLGSVYFPGTGLLLTVFFIIILGAFISQPFILRIFGLIELPFTNIPVVKSIYSSIKSFADYFSDQNNEDTKQAVILTIPETDIRMVGLVTRANLQDLPQEFKSKSDQIAVYLPMSYMVGGYTLFVPKESVKPIPIRVEEVMRNSLFAWLSKSDGKR